MKKALPRSLKPEKREILKKITDLILEKVPDVQMIILFGSYARGNYVEYDERKDFGVYTVFRSDFDLLILLDTEIKDGIKNKIHKAASACLRIKGNDTATELIALEVDVFNRYLSEGRYFYTDIKNEGVMLYNSGKYKLARSRKLNYSEIKDMAVDYYDEKRSDALMFLAGAKFHFNEGKTDKRHYKIAAFNLHQTAENLYNAILLTYTLTKKKEHDLTILKKKTKKCAPELATIFPITDKTERHLFSLLKKAYIEGRYNKDYVITPEEVQRLIERIERFAVVAEYVCQQRFAVYDQLIKEGK